MTMNPSSVFNVSPTVPIEDGLPDSQASKTTTTTFSCNFPTGTDEEFFRELKEILPGAVGALQAAGKLVIFKKFLQLLCAGLFPFMNIAFLLFLDVVQFMSCKSTVQDPGSGT